MERGSSMLRGVPVGILDSLEVSGRHAIPVLRIAYLVNQYPKVSHSFIRREILAVERQGVEVMRIALRGWDAVLADPEDVEEQRRTRYVLADGMLPLFLAAARAAVLTPLRFSRALGLAFRMSRGSERGLAYHLTYVAEACRILGWLREWGAAHLHAHFGTNGAEIAMLVDALGGPGYSFTVHGPEEFDKPQALALGEKVRRAAFVAAVSSFGRSQIMRWAGYEDWQKIVVVHCGVDDSFLAAPLKQVPSEFRLVCVGRLCEQKGQLLLVEAIAQLASRGVACHLVLAGDGEMRREVEAAIARHELNSRVRITGWIDGSQVREEMLAARALVLPSFAEGLPVVIMEALALRRPVVTTFVAGIPELVRQRENGWLVPAGDVDALARALEDVLSQPTSELARMGEAGRRRVIDQHSIDAEATKLVDLFNRVGRPSSAGQSLERAAA